MLENRIRRIPIQRQLIRNYHPDIKQKKVCAYCRVSTDSDNQLGSFELQCKYYTEYIKNNPAWQLTGIYADHGISGTSSAQRKNFLQMIEDCRTGKVEMIITKSISRFARNTVDCLNYVRELQNLNPPVGIFFEKENIDTLDAKSELLLTILSSLAQEESRSNSENIKWAIQKKFQAGIPRCPTVFLYGYDTDKDGNIVVIPDEAAIVQRIYTEYLSGKGATNIAKDLHEEGILTVKGGVWYKSSVLRILRNEKYCGDVLMQKNYIPDYLTHKEKQNNGEKTRWYLENHHPAIISRDMWNAAQTERNERRNAATEENKNRRIGYSNVSVFSNTLFCGLCGQPVTRSTQYNKGENKKIYVWKCRAASTKSCREDGYTYCFAKMQYDEIIKSAFMNMLINLKNQREKLASKPENTRLVEILDTITDDIDFNELYYRELVKNGLLYDEGKIKFTFRCGVKYTASFIPHYLSENYRRKIKKG